ncbi:MAG TPA: glycosyltransferase family 4 protein [Candidatus Krumholzibacteria bacterium]|nr:glycosyltransferase family 4 protein [Candidatus Krumholzibacteria bacterium]
MSPSPQQLDYGVLLPGVGVFGGVRRFIEIGNELVRRGNRYIIYHPSGEAPGWLPFAGETRPSALLDAARHDVLICNDPPLVPAFARAPARLKLFYFALEGIPGERRIARSRDWVAVANSSGMALHLRRRHGVRAETAIGGVDPGAFRPPAVPRAGDGTVRVLAFGRTSRRRKGVATAIRAAERFARSAARRGGVDVTLVLFDHVGAGNERDPREAVHSRLPVDFHVNPTQAELAALYGGCDLFVSAEKRAGWSNTVAEAMACGTPVVCTRSGTQDLAIHMESAWVTRWRHPFFLARGLDALQRDPATAQRLAAAALVCVRGFAWPHVVDQLEEIVRRGLRGAR